MRGRNRPLIRAIAAIAALAALGASPGAAEATTAHASPIARAAASHSSAKAGPDRPAPTCGTFQLEASYYGTWLLNSSTGLTFNPDYADELCQFVVSGSNVVIYDLSANPSGGDYCLAYSAASKHVYLHFDCPLLGAPSYEQWKFLPLPNAPGLYVLENGYEINGGYYCMEEDGNNAPPMGGCSPENHQAVMYLHTS